MTVVSPIFLPSREYFIFPTVFPFDMGAVSFSGSSDVTVIFPDLPLGMTAQKVSPTISQNSLSPPTTSIFLGITIALKMHADAFLRPETLLILGLGLVAFIFDTAGGVLFAKLINLFSKKKINPMIGAAGISAFPMSGRVVHKLGLEADNTNYLLMHSIGVNVSGQIASVIAGGMILNLLK